MALCFTLHLRYTPTTKCVALLTCCMQDLNTTYRTGGDVAVRSSFISNGALDNSQDTNFRAINNDWPVFAFAHDLGEVGSRTRPIIISIGHARDPALEYIIDKGVIQHRSPYFLTQYASVVHVVCGTKVL